MPQLETLPATDFPYELRDDFPLYASGCLIIRDKAAKLIPLKLNRAQRIVYEKRARQKAETGRVRLLILKARQEGISTEVEGLVFRGCSLWPNRRGMVIADKSERGAELFGICERFYDHLPSEVRPRKRWSRKGQHLHFGLPGGGGLDSQITVETAGDVYAGRALTIHYLHVSEIAFWEKPDDTWLSLIQAVPDEGSEVYVESTANGVGNFFHRLWEAAEAGQNGFLPVFLPWFIHDEYQVTVTDVEREEILGSLTDEERAAYEEGIEYEGEPHKLMVEQIAWRRRTIRDKCEGDERLFRQEYPSTAREAFLVSGNCFFDEEALLRHEANVREPIARGNLVERDGGIVFAPGQRGYLRVWFFPERDQQCAMCEGKGTIGLQPARNLAAPSCPVCQRSGRVGTRYVVFADTAMGRKVAARATDFTDPEAERGGRDFSSADVFEAESRRFVAQLHGRMAPEVFAQELWRLGQWYSSSSAQGSKRTAALLGVERNHSSGETVLRILKDDLRYPTMFYRRQINRRTNEVTSEVGWMTTGETRMPMLDELAAAIREDTVEYPCREGIKELWTFVRGDDGRPEAQDGCHDDRVISAAGCLQMARWSSAPPLGEVAKPEVSDRPTGW